ncbi:MAG: LicD family protein [Eubacterium sp.]|nr:LicD family protein [Eubacterium sp.]
MDKKTLEKIHIIQVDMIKKLHNYCKEKKLNYSVICGSLLGAIRHKGIIPWDDDVDIALIREEYNELVRLLKKDPIEGLYIQDYSTDPYYYQPYAKLLKNNTEYIEGFRKNNKSKSGVFIDIFPLDYIKKPGMKKTKFRRTISRFITFAIWNKEGCHMEREGSKKLINGVSKIISVLPKSLLIIIQNKLVIRKRKDKKYVASMFSSNYETDRLYFEVSDFESLIELPFEDTVVNAPKNWKENLTRLYKDYMALPPEDKRNSGHDVYKVSID